MGEGLLVSGFGRSWTKSCVGFGSLRVMMLATMLIEAVEGAGAGGLLAGAHPVVIALVVGAAVCVIALPLFAAVSGRLPGDSKAPPMVACAPVVGGLLKFLGGPMPMMQDLYGKYGEVFRVPVFNRNFTFLLGPQLTTNFFKGRDDQVSQKEVYEFNVPTFGKGVVFDVDIKVRQEQFRMLKDNLRSNMLKTYVSMMVDEANTFFAKWGEEGEVDLAKALPDLVILTASRTLLGKEIRENLFERVADLVHDLDVGMVPLSVVAPYAPIAPHRRRDRARKELGEIFAKVIRGRRDSGERESDLLQALIDAHYKGGQPLTEDEITGILIATLFAGQHTSSITSVWTGMHLIHAPHEMASVLDEQRASMAKHGSDLTYDALNEMDVMHRAIKEALRLHPPLMMLMRYVRKPFDVTTADGRTYTIPVGETVVTSPSFVHRLEHIFKDPLKYMPSRFEDEDAHEPFAFQAFGGGRHSCLGEVFAYMQIKAIWSCMLRQFEFEPVLADSDFPESNYAAMVVGPEKPCLVRY